MKTETNSAALLRVRLPSDIVIPATADLNALMRVLGQARKIETVIKTSDNAWDGDMTYYTEGSALPEVKVLDVELHADKTTAQERRDKNGEAYRARHASPESVAI